MGRAAAAAAAEVSCHNDTDPRIASMQRNIQFLQQQHKETLEKLHAEIDYLRRENKGEETSGGKKMSFILANKTSSGRV